MATTKTGTKKTAKKQKKKRLKKQAVLSVVSVRISDQEKECIDKMMRAGIISSYSDVLRLALKMIRVPANDKNEYAENIECTYHSKYGDVASPLQIVCRNNDAVQSQLRHVCQAG